MKPRPKKIRIVDYVPLTPEVFQWAVKAGDIGVYDSSWDIYSFDDPKKKLIPWLDAE